MKKSWLFVLLILSASMLFQGCYANSKCRKEETVRLKREKPMTVVRTVGPGDTHGEIAHGKWDTVLVVEGAGSFLSAVVSKKSKESEVPIITKDSKKTTVRLWLDKKPILIKSFEVARAMGLAGHNYSGVAWFDGQEGIETLVLGYGEPLFFTRGLELSIKIDDDQVEKAFLSMTYTKEDTGEDEGTSGGDGEGDYP